MAFDFTNKVDPKASRAIYLQLLDMIHVSLCPSDVITTCSEADSPPLVAFTVHVPVSYTHLDVYKRQ